MRYKDDNNFGQVWAVILAAAVIGWIFYFTWIAN